MRRAARLPLVALEPYLLEIPGAKRAPAAAAGAPQQVLDWRDVFGNTHPVEIEVGFGKGLFLLLASQAKPAVNFLGIEIERKYQLYTATRIAKRKLANVRLVCGDARVVLAEATPPASVQAVHVYFPDPWWKQRHRKRRVFTGEFAAACARVLQPGGRLHVATDVEAYFAVIQTLVEARPSLRTLNNDIAAPDGGSLTNFERKYREAGKPIWRAAYEKSS